MTRYRIEFDRRVKKDFKAVPPKQIIRIKAAIADLADNPNPTGAKKLKGQNRDYFRIRVGDFRVVYTIENDILLIIVIRIGHRRELYKKL